MKVKFELFWEEKKEQIRLDPVPILRFLRPKMGMVLIRNGQNIVHIFPFRFKIINFKENKDKISDWLIDWVPTQQWKLALRPSLE